MFNLYSGLPHIIYMANALMEGDTDNSPLATPVHV